MSELIGGLFGMLLLIISLTAGITGVKEWYAVQALSFAAQQAVTTEALSGCWTPYVSSLTAAVLQDHGLTPTKTTVTAYTTGPGAPYGAPVVVGLSYPVPIGVFGIANMPATVTVAAQTTATSQWVPSPGTSSNSACAAPSPFVVAPGAGQMPTGGGPYNGY